MGEVNVGEDMEIEGEDMEEREEAVDMVAVEGEIEKEVEIEDMEETAMPAEVDLAEVVDMVADMVADVEAVEVPAMKEAEEEDKKEDSTAKASRPQLIR